MRRWLLQLLIAAATRTSQAAAVSGSLRPQRAEENALPSLAGLSRAGPAADSAAAARETAPREAPHPPVPQPPAAGAWATGEYRNLFVESGRCTAAQSQAKVQAVFQQLFYGDEGSQRLFYWADAAKSEAYILSVDSGDVRSEGMSYGMMIAVQLHIFPALAFSDI